MKIPQDSWVYPLLDRSPRLKATVQSFIESLEERRAQVQEAFAKDQVHHLETIAHQTFGTASSYGFKRLAVAASSLEKAVASKQPTRIEQAVRWFVASTEELVASSETQRRLLIIEDDPHLVSLVCLLLEGSGLQCVAANDGPQALSLLKSESFDLVLLDLNLPTMSGLAILDKVRERGLTVPVVAMSGHLEPSIIERALEAGAAGYLKKPLDAQTTCQSLLSYLGNSHLSPPPRPTHSGSNP
jgi:CheY-like chemotaxis protein